MLRELWHDCLRHAYRSRSEGVPSSGGVAEDGTLGVGGGPYLRSPHPGTGIFLKCQQVFKTPL